MSVAEPFCLAWFRREDYDGTRSIDSTTSSWIEALSKNRHVWSSADGATGLVSSEKIYARGSTLVALRSDGPMDALVTAIAADDQDKLGTWPRPFAAMAIRQQGRALSLLRAPLGQFPLFYQDNGQLLVACINLGALLARPGWQRRLDREAACHYLAFGTAGSGRTLEAGTRVVPAAHILNLRRRGGAYLHRYWSPLAVPGPKLLDEKREKSLRQDLEASICSAGSVDRTAILLSGGIDSGYMAHVLGKKGLTDRMDAYTIKFTTPGVQHECEGAAQTAHDAGIRHHAVAMSAADAASRLSEVLSAAQPRSAWSTLTHGHLLDVIRADGHHTLLSGLGADEVFGGYSHYLKAYIRFRQLLKEQTIDYERCLDDVLAQHRLATDILFTGVPRFLDDEVLRQVAGPSLSGWSHIGETTRFYREAREICPRAHLFELMVAQECQHRVPDLLLSGFDADASRHHITVRYPFLVPQIAGQACRLGATERYDIINGSWKNKVALRRMAATALPPDVFARQPMTFGAPFLAWFSEPSFRKVIESTLDITATWLDDLLDRRWVISLLHRVRTINALTTPPPPEADQLWIVITLVAWYRHWICDEELK